MTQAPKGLRQAPKGSGMVFAGGGDYLEVGEEGLAIGNSRGVGAARDQNPDGRREKKRQSQGAFSEHHNLLLLPLWRVGSDQTELYAFDGVVIKMQLVFR